MKTIFKISGISKSELLLLGILLVINTVLGLLQPIFIGNIIDSFKNSDRDAVIVTCMSMSFLFCVALVVTYIKDLVAVKLAVKSERKIRDKIIQNSVLRTDISDTGRVITNLEEDAKVISTMIFEQLELLIDALSIVITFILMLKLSPNMTILIILLVPLQYVVLRIFSVFFRKQEFLIRTKKEDYLEHATETIMGRKTISIFDSSSKRNQEFSKINILFGKVRKKFFLTQTLQGIIIQSILFIYNIGIILYGFLIISRGNLTIGEFVAYITYSNSILVSSIGVSEINAEYQKIKVSVYRLLESIHHIHTEGIKELATSKKIERFEMKNIKFSYNKNLILDNVSLEFKKGKLYVLNSPSGRGKTTLFNIISGIKEAESGYISVNGNVISSLKSKVSYMTQDDEIFTMSVFDNIKFYDDDIKLENVINICKKFEIDYNITKLERGYDTVLTPNNLLLSGGQIKRICLSRALLRKNDIYLLDEPVANLDRRTRNIVVNYLRELSKDAIVIVSSHDDIFSNETDILVEL
ncbi:ABC transporter transmembrane domain-containing protein [Ligilactobacillus animalis]|jgi:ATP-binding cassette subfamily B protein|uniref:ABC transporter transmembrane domain-containing protein n=1 Tax=Ligilactobacillus animalis TaxID=1605 RepID=UPI0025963956|nr:ABC transporter ATP-binding protein [Ligilactobacillus animalis]